MEENKELLYSSIAFNLTSIRPYIFHRIPPELLHSFLPGTKPKILKKFIPEQKINDLTAITKMRIENEIEKVKAQDIKLISIFNSDYPATLKHLSDAPPLLYITGKHLSRVPKLSIIGPRKPTSYGIDVTEYFLERLAHYNIETVSGLAMGIDALVHRLSLEHGLSTLAIIGTGIDICYPRSNRSLYKKIKECGTIISEFPPGTPALKHNFPRRNRIIAALSAGTLIVEATPASGSLITASFASDLGRDVFAVPGNIFNYNSTGTNKLILQGAKPTLNINDILEERAFSSLTQRAIPSLPTIRTGKTQNFQIPDYLLKELLKYLKTPKRLDNIIDFCKKRNYRFSYSILMILELNGLVKVTQNNLIYRVVNESGKESGNSGITGKSEANRKISR